MPVPIAAPDKVIEMKPKAINLEAVIANKFILVIALVFGGKFYT
jgi:hypothetical protein